MVTGIDLYFQKPFPQAKTLAFLMGRALSGKTTMDPEIPVGVIRTPAGHYVLQNDSHLSHWVDEQGTLEVARGEILANFARYIPQGGTVIDAGASLGDHIATYEKLVGPKGNVFAFEPNYLPFCCLKLNFADKPNVHCINNGLSMVEETRQMFIADNVGASHLMSDAEAKQTPVSEWRGVKCFTLDSFMPRFKRLDFVHIDVEGFEPKVLIGGRETLTRFRPVMVLEIQKHALSRQNMTEHDVYKALESLAYTYKELPGCTPDMLQRDVLCLPR